MTMADEPNWEDLGIVERGLWCDLCLLPSVAKIEVKDTDGHRVGYSHVCVDCGTQFDD